jgi:hypothetical protein
MLIPFGVVNCFGAVSDFCYPTYLEFQVKAPFTLWESTENGGKTGDIFRSVTFVVEILQLLGYYFCTSSFHWEQVLYELEFAESTSRSRYSYLRYEHSRCGSLLADSDAPAADQGPRRAGQLADSDAPATDQGPRRAGQLADSDASTADQRPRGSRKLGAICFAAWQLAELGDHRRSDRNQLNTANFQLNPSVPLLDSLHSSVMRNRREVDGEPN